jgi:hypothetical protein
MTAIEALEALNAMQQGGDNEADHAKADQILVDFLKSHDPACADVARAFEAARERVCFWYT